MKKFTETEITDGLKANDGRICKYLFDLHYTSLLFFAEKLIDDRPEAEDIVVNTFNKFWNIRERFSNSINIKAFLYISVRNNCLDFLRFRQRQNEGKKELLTQLEAIQQPPNIENLIIESDFLNRVYLKVQELPEKCRKVFILTYFDGLKASEIAEKLNITVSTVTTQRSRALKYLRENLGNEDYFLVCFILASCCGDRFLN